MFFGIILVAVGIAFLLNNLGIISVNFWGYFWPILVIAIGLKMIMARKHDHWHNLYHYKEKFHKDFDNCCGHSHEEKDNNE